MPEPLPEAIVTNLFSECAIYQLSYCFSPRQYGTPLSPPIVYFGQPFGRGPHLAWLRFHISHARFLITLLTFINSSCIYNSSVFFILVSVFFCTASYCCSFSVLFFSSFLYIFFFFFFFF